MAIIAFVIFAVVFCYLMDKWSRDLDEIERESSESNLVVANFSGRVEADELKRAA